MQPAGYQQPLVIIHQSHESVPLYKATSTTPKHCLSNDYSQWPAALTWTFMFYRELAPSAFSAFMFALLILSHLKNSENILCLLFLTSGSPSVSLWDTCLDEAPSLDELYPSYPTSSGLSWSSDCPSCCSEAAFHGYVSFTHLDGSSHAALLPYSCKKGRKGREVNQAFFFNKTLLF